MIQLKNNNGFIAVDNIFESLDNVALKSLNVDLNKIDVSITKITVAILNSDRFSDVSGFRLHLIGYKTARTSCRIEGQG